VHPVEADGPTALGSVQLQTRRHARDLGDLTDEEAEHLGPLLRRISRCLTEVSHAEWCYCYLFLEGYRHVHFVLSARFPGLPPEHLRLNAHTWSGAPHGSRADVIALGRSLGEALHAATGSR
jgi:diadenosine tetraphosphate (Ap4A) HIT family hydrolase